MNRSSHYSHAEKLEAPPVGLHYRFVFTIARLVIADTIVAILLPLVHIERPAD